MNKRRRTSSMAGKVVDEDDDSQSADTSRTRKRLKAEPVDLIQQLYDVIRNHKKDDGSLLCDSFIRAPKRRQEPAYYEVVSNPIDLLKVQQKLKTEEYEDIDDFVADIELMVSNAKAFYKRTSQEYKDANELWDLLQTTKSKLFDEKQDEEDTKPHRSAGRPPGRPGRKPLLASVKVEVSDDTSEESNDEEILLMCEDLFTAVMQAETDDARALFPPFQLLPSKKRYPEYYEVIDAPIDLKMIGTKIQQGKYSSLNEMEKDLLLMTKNACTFNEPGSQIYKDSKALRKIVQAKKVEIEQGKFSPPGKGSDRIRTKRFRSGNSLSATAAALKYEDEEEDDDENDVIDVDEPDNPCWQLFDTVKSHTSPQGSVLAEPFMKLPSRRFYPDYFKEIRNPISLAQISKKLQKGDYGTVSEVAGDLNIMFENAKKYNRPDSKLYKDAVKLQKVMQKRVKELLDFDHEYSNSEDDSNDEPPSKKERISKSIGSPPAGSSNATPVSSTTKLLTRGKYMDNIPLKKRLYLLCKCLMNFMDEGGRQPMLSFMEKPSKKLYPDYYEVIDKPMDMMTIESNIKAEKYQSEEEILADFKRMFANCRKYNEVGSMIYEDAKRLEKVLMDKVKELGPLSEVRPIEKEKDASFAKKTPKSTLTAPKPKKLILSSPFSPKLLDHATSHKLRTLYHSVRDFKDPKGRQLSQIFLKLPSKTEYPDYYEVIKKPINLEQISQKLKGNGYDGLDDLCSDFILMFENACKYNEPDSQIYKDALALQKVVMQTKLQLRQDEQSVPDVPLAVQELLMSLFISVYNHQDEEGRCFSDSMQELPEHDEVDGKKVRALSLDLIKRRLDAGQYKRLDAFQEDVFSCFQRARNLSRSDSQVFEDSVELQTFFIRQRDELCQNGDLLHSPALNYGVLELSNAVDVERTAKQSTEQPEIEDQDTKPSFKDEANAGTADNALSYNQQVYRIGDFVYAEGKERGMDPIILNIQRLWTNQEGQQMLYGNQYYRPNETYHVTTRKFLEKEVFKTEQNVAIPLNQVLGRCCVLSVKDYFRSKPEGVDEKDVYVCESRYSARARAFKKIKNWPVSLMPGYRLVTREEPLEPKRVMSVFRQRVEKHKEEIAELEEQERVVEKERPNVPVNPQPADCESDITYYEQLNAPTCLIKTGDCMYLKSDSSRVTIAQADKIWMNKDGEGFFRGPWIMLPSEVHHPPTRTFYKQEVFISSIEETHSVKDIVSKCVVLEHSEYISCRQTEYSENDVFVCESVYEEGKRQIRELPQEGLKKYIHSASILQDEIYFFRRLINPPKFPIHLLNAQAQASASDSLQAHTSAPSQPSQSSAAHLLSTQLENSRALSKIKRQFRNFKIPGIPCQELPTVKLKDIKVDSDMMMEDSLDGPPPSVGSADIPPPVSTITTPVSTKKAKASGKKSLVTGYILYSGDIRKSIASSNPDCNFGEVSRIVGNEWRKLSASEKASWEEKAARINEETANRPPSPVPSPAPPLPTEVVFECAWDNCDWQFEDNADAVEHAVADPNGHVNIYFQSLIAAGQTDIEYQCQWRGCTRTKKTIPPFPNLQRILRHVKEVHLLKSTGRAITLDQRSKRYMPSRKAALLKAAAANAAGSGSSAAVAGMSARNTPSPSSQNGAGSSAAASAKLPDPLFISVPPRSQRLLHSDAYIKYIEGLNPDNRSVGNWEKQMKATQTNTEPPDPSRLPTNWISNRQASNKDNVLTALWTLRDFMFRDALGISKNL